MVPRYCATLVYNRLTFCDLLQVKLAVHERTCGDCFNKFCTGLMSPYEQHKSSAASYSQLICNNECLEALLRLHHLQSKRRRLCFGRLCPCFRTCVHVFTISQVSIDGFLLNVCHLVHLGTKLNWLGFGVKRSNVKVTLQRRCSALDTAVKFRFLVLHSLHWQCVHVGWQDESFTPCPSYTHCEFPFQVNYTACSLPTVPYCHPHFARYCRCCLV